MLAPPRLVGLVETVDSDTSAVFAECIHLFEPPANVVTAEMLLGGSGSNFCLCFVDAER